MTELLPVTASFFFSFAEDVFCPSLSNPEFGEVEVTGQTPDSIATYTCMSGFVLDGNVNRVCQRSGLWNGSDPVCNRKLGFCGGRGQAGSVLVFWRAICSKNSILCKFGFKENVNVRYSVEKGVNWTVLCTTSFKECVDSFFLHSTQISQQNKIHCGFFLLRQGLKKIAAATHSKTVVKRWQTNWA